MKNEELDSILKSARTPELSDESQESFARRVRADLGRDSTPRRAPRSLFPRFALTFGLAACVLVALAIYRRHGESLPLAVQSSDLLSSARLVRGMLAMFPNRVRAIVEDERGMNLILSDESDVPASAPLYLRICDGQKCSSFVTFSGQEIHGAGQQLTVLSDAHGGIILTGPQFVWSSHEGNGAGDHLKIEAETLGPSAM